jgi:hypothetical protein
MWSNKKIQGVIQIQGVLNTFQMNIKNVLNVLIFLSIRSLSVLIFVSTLN